MKQDKRRLAFDFDNSEQMADFIEQAREAGLNKKSAQVVRAETDDFLKVGVTRNNTFVIVKKGSRPDAEAFTLTTTATHEP